MAPRLLRRVRAAAKRAIGNAIDSGARTVTIREIATVADEDMRLEIVADVGGRSTRHLHCRSRKRCEHDQGFSVPRSR